MRKVERIFCHKFGKFLMSVLLLFNITWFLTYIQNDVIVFIVHMNGTDMMGKKPFFITEEEKYNLMFLADHE